MPSAWLHVLLVLTILGAWMIGPRLWQHYTAPHPELVRKLVHIPMGIMTLSFPWLFDSAVPVVILGVLAIAWLLALRYYKPLATRLGSVLGGVERRSLGEIYFPISVVLVFLLSQGHPLLYTIPLLVLTLADAVAALIGVRYGQHHYTATEGPKSAEGSVSFFMVAFFSVHVPLLLSDQTGRAETLVIAVILGLLVMVLEAIAWQGLDNLFIPLGTLILLRTHLTMDLPELLVRLVVTLGLVALVLIWRKRTTLNDSALLGAAFVGYLSWTLGGWRWLLPPLILFLAYPRMVPSIDAAQLDAAERAIMRWLPSDPHLPRRQWERVHNVHAVISVCGAGLLWLAVFGLTEQVLWLYPYTVAFAANLAVIGVAGLRPRDYWRPQQWVVVGRSIGIGWLVMLVPMWVLNPLSVASLGFAIAALGGTALAAIAYYLCQPWLRSRPTDTPAWVSRALLTTLGSLLGVLPVFLGSSAVG